MIEHIFIISCLCLGIHSLTREHSIFWFWNNIVYDKNTLNRNSILFEPLTECIGCMSSFWTILYLLIINEFYEIILIQILIVFVLLIYDFSTNRKFDFYIKNIYLAFIFLVLFCFFEVEETIVLICCNGLLEFISLVKCNIEDND